MASNATPNQNREAQLKQLLQEREALTHQNQELAIQVNQLIKTENRLFQFQSDLDRQVTTYQKLADLGNALNQTFDCDRVVSLAIEFALYELGFERCLFFLFDHDTQFFKVSAFDGYYDEAIATLLPQVEIACTDRLSNHTQPIILIYPENSSDGTLAPWCSTFHMDEYAAVVLHHETQSTLGMLVVGNTAEMWNYHTRILPESSTMIGLSNLSNQVAIAISNIRSYNAQQQQNQELEKIVQTRTQELNNKNKSLRRTLQQLRSAQAQLIHNEKMLGLSQFVSGFAHEINNSVNVIYANIDVAQSYMQDLLSLISNYQQQYPQPTQIIQRSIAEIDLAFLKADFPKLFHSTLVGTERIQKIMQSLKSFTRNNQANKKRVNIHDGINSALMLLEHRLGAHDSYPAIDIVKHYGQLPLVDCYAAQLNQVFMHILNNSIDALRSQPHSDQPPQIAIITHRADELITIRITDNGPGIPKEIESQIFEPFFTTKEIGQGPGLGLSNSYQIIQNQHGGSLRYQSQIGIGTTFEIIIPHSQPRSRLD